jgi:nucleotide-binding universal stress UspA family protein
MPTNAGDYAFSTFLIGASDIPVTSEIEPESSSMPGFLLVVLNRADTAHACLQAAAQIAVAMRDARILALCVRVDPASTILPSEEVLTNERRTRLESDATQLAAAINRIYNSWLDEHPDWAGRTSWSDPVSTIQQQLKVRGRGADLIVLASPVNAQETFRREALQTAIFDAKRPVLVVPNKVVETIGRSIAIIWGNEPSTVNAVLDAMPLLDRAQEIYVLITMDADAPRPELPQLLIDHGVDAVIHPITSGSSSRGRALLAHAHQLRADLLVMGAYPHPLVELLPGGLTRYMASHTDLPILMRH